MIVYVVCFDIEDDKVRRKVGKLMGSARQASAKISF